MIPFWYAVPSISAILAGGCLFLGSGMRRFHRYMGFTFIFEGLLLMLAGIMRARLSSFYLPIYLLYVAMMLLSPLCYLFAVRSVSNESGLRGRDGFLLTMPAAVLLVVAMVCGSVPTLDRNLFFSLMYGNFPLPGTVSGGVAVMLSLDNSIFIIALTEQIVIQLFCFLSFRRYVGQLERYYSTTQGKSLGLLAAILSLMALRLLVMVPLGFMPLVTSAVWFKIAQSAVYLLFYIALALFVYKIRFTAEELEKSINTQEQRALPPAADDVISARMGTLIEERFFTDPSVTLLDISSRIHINTKYLADYLRYHYNETFMIFVNRLRIEYAATLMEEGILPLSEISERSGFISPSTFYRNFTKMKGVSPSQYKKTE